MRDAGLIQRLGNQIEVNQRHKADLTEHMQHLVDMEIRPAFRLQEINHPVQDQLCDRQGKEPCDTPNDPRMNRRVRRETVKS